MTPAPVSRSDTPFNRFVFYDVETTGLSPAFDQILQLAAIRTGPSFSDSEPGVEIHDLRVRRARHVVPSPTAMLMTHLTGSDLNSGQPFVEAMRRAHGLFRRWAPATFIGYNSLRFEEELLRHSFCQALLPPFVTQVGGSTRADLMRIAQALSVVEPDAIVVPKDADGRSSFRLGPLARANGVIFDELQAHDALADVRATMALARSLRDRAPQAFGWALELAHRARALDLILGPGACSRCVWSQARRSCDHSWSFPASTMTGTPLSPPTSRLIPISTSISMPTRWRRWPKGLCPRSSRCGQMPTR